MASDETPLACARRDRDLASIVKDFAAKPVPPVQSLSHLLPIMNGVGRLRASADDPNVARLERGQLTVLYAYARDVYAHLMGLASNGLLSSMQVNAALRGVGGLVERWAKPPEFRFAHTAYDEEVDQLAGLFETLLKAVLLLERIYDNRQQGQDISDDSLSAAQRDAVTFHFLTAPLNPLARDA